LSQKEIHINRRSAHLSIWKFILAKLSANENAILLCVLESEGSSPGRAGFKMAVATDGSFSGTIGGGIMEHKLVERAKSLLQKSETKVLLQKQFHDKQAATDQSGMICSGSQLNAFVPVTAEHKKIVEDILSENIRKIRISAGGFEAAAKDTEEGLRFNTDADWDYTEKTDNRPVLHIVGGGHVSLAVSELMSFVGFCVKVYDDRPALNTIEENIYADETIIIKSYEELSDHLIYSADDYIVIMTVGYRTDKIVLKQLLGKPLRYLGLMGSDHKINTLFNELRQEGILSESLARVAAPVGINILSKTTPEIAVSIAAEIIKEKNKEFPTGRNKE
jgi:xanthine dehydrogenase accessory factor